MKQLRRRGGSAAIEFALVMPVLLAVISGTFDFGWYFVRSQLALQATYEGCRKGAMTDVVDDPAAAAVARVQSSLESLQIDPLTAEITATLSGTAPDQVITVTTSIPFDPAVGLVPLPGSVDAQMTMRLEDN